MQKRPLVLNADQLRKGLPATDYGLRKLRETIDRRRNAIYIVLDNVLDTYNIGSIFRLADAVAAKKVYLCGSTETPPNPRIKKASINTTEWVEWEWCDSAVEAVRKVREQWSRHPERLVKDLPRNRKISHSVRNDKEGLVIAIEQSKKSVLYDQFNYTMPICLVVGHESDGVSKKVLDICDAVVELPMFGVNKSLNVMVSLGIVLYEVLEKTS